MIQANELRVWNWVLIDEDGKWNPYQVEGVVLASKDNKVQGFVYPFITFKIGACVLGFEDDTEDDELVRPIPLKPNILEKCGFKKSGKTSYLLEIKDSGIIEWEDDGSILIANDSTELGFVTNCICKYLHQLQNLYFALTGQELNVNIK